MITFVEWDANYFGDANPANGQINPWLGASPFVSGDYMLVLCYSLGEEPATATGWDKLGQLTVTYDGGAATDYFALFGKFYAGESGPYDFYPPGTPTAFDLVIVAYRGVDANAVYSIAHVGYTDDDSIADGVDLPSVSIPGGTSGVHNCPIVNGTTATNIGAGFHLLLRGSDGDFRLIGVAIIEPANFPREFDAPTGYTEDVDFQAGVMFCSKAVTAESGYRFDCSTIDAQIN